MTKANSTKTNHHVSTNATTHEGETAMKTTKKTHATTDTATQTNGETTMTTTQPKTLNETIAAPAATDATPTVSPTVAGYLATCTALLKQFDAAFPQTESLTAKDKNRMAKARKGSERYTPQLVALARAHGVSLASVPLDQIESASKEATQLVPLQKQIERLTVRVQTRSFSANSSSWGGSTKLYTVLKRLSKDDGELAAGLAEIEQYFNHRHPLVAADHPKTKKGKEALAAKKAAATPATTTAPAASGETAPPQATGTTVEPSAPAPSTTSAATNGATHA